MVAAVSLDGAGAVVAQAAQLRRMAVEARSARGRPGPARIAVAGEFNSGKTALVNALAGMSVLPAGVMLRTPCPTVVGFARRRSLSAEGTDGRRASIAWERLGSPGEGTMRLRVGVPASTLEGLRVLDTPGLGLGDEAADLRVLRGCRSADLLVWCTPAFQAWKQSERALWLSLPARVRERGILAVTFADQIASEEFADRLMARLRSEAGLHFRDILLIANARDGEATRPGPVSP